MPLSIEINEKNEIKRLIFELIIHSIKMFVNKYILVSNLLPTNKIYINQ